MTAETRRQRWGLGLLLVGLGFAGFDLYLILQWGVPGSSYNRGEIVQMLAWIVTGYLAVRAQPTSRMGLLMLAVGLCLAANSPVGLFLTPAAPDLSAVLEVSHLLTGIQVGLAVHCVLAYPTGRLRGRGEVGVVAAAYSFGAVTVAIDELNIRTVDQALGVVSPIGYLVIIAAAVVVFFVGLRTASPRERRILRLPIVCILVAAVVFALWQVQLVSFRLVPFPALLWFQYLSIATIPLAFFYGLWRERWSQGGVANLLRDLPGMPVDAIGGALARALGDRDLRLGFPAPGGFRDAAGDPVALPEHLDPRVATIVGDPEAPVAVIVHDRSLLNEQTLIRAATTAVRLALENARLRADRHTNDPVRQASGGPVFLSYAREDRDYARQLAGFLAARAIPVWMDEAIDYGDRWEQTIAQQIDGCAAVVVVMTPAAEASAWVANEMFRAEARGKSVLPLLRDGDVFFRFGHAQYDDVTSGAMPSDRFLSRLRAMIGVAETQEPDEPSLSPG